GVAVSRLGGAGLGEDGGDGARERGVEQAGRAGGRAGGAGDRGVGRGGGGGGRGGAGGGGLGEGGQGVGVGSSGDGLALAARLLGRHERGSADRLALSRERFRGVGVEESGSEVEDDRRPGGGHQDVGGLEVAVDHGPFVERLHGVGDRDEE